MHADWAYGMGSGGSACSFGAGGHGTTYGVSVSGVEAGYDEAGYEACAYSSMVPAGYTVLTGVSANWGQNTDGVEPYTGYGEGTFGAAVYGTMPASHAGAITWMQGPGGVPCVSSPSMWGEGYAMASESFTGNLSLQEPDLQRQRQRPRPQEWQQLQLLQQQQQHGSACLQFAGEDASLRGLGCPGDVTSQPLAEQSLQSDGCEPSCSAVEPASRERCPVPAGLSIGDMESLLQVSWESWARKTESKEETRSPRPRSWSQEVSVGDGSNVSEATEASLRTLQAEAIFCPCCAFRVACPFHAAEPWVPAQAASSCKVGKHRSAVARLPLAGARRIAADGSVLAGGISEAVGKADDPDGGEETSTEAGSSELWGGCASDGWSDVGDGNARHMGLSSWISEAAPVPRQSAPASAAGDAQPPSKGLAAKAKTNQRGPRHAGASALAPGCHQPALG